MKYITLLFLTLLSFSFCSNDPHSNTKSKLTENYQDDRVYVPEIAASYSKSGPIQVDSVLKAKVVKSFALLQKYTQKSTLFPKKISDNIINCFKGITFGRYYKNRNLSYKFQFEQPPQKDFLNVFFENVPLVASDHAGLSFSNGKDSNVIPVVLIEELVRNSSDTFLAAVLMHELTHVNFFFNKLLQDPKQDNQNELIAYQRELIFLSYMYGGPEKELQAANLSGKPERDVPLKEREKYIFCLNKVKELFLLVSKN